ncbi:MAG: hypothetical protein DYG89_28610 [Caldilinea sp. CFX5]|nr:hypothetical protein [Caldilinea sp. CFX5]
MDELGVKVHFNTEVKEIWLIYGKCEHLSGFGNLTGVAGRNLTLSVDEREILVARRKTTGIRLADGTHPGAGLPGVLSSAKIVDDLVRTTH